MSDPFIAEVRLFGFNFAPRNWAACNGQLLPLAQNTALFSLLGTTYGGNGTTNFALPDLQGRAAIHWGSGSGGIPQVDQGEQGGVETVTLTQNQMPQHTHGLNATNDPTNSPSPGGNVLATTASPKPGPAYSNAASNTSLNALAIANAGGGQPHNNLQPYLTVNFCIALQGIYPSRA